MKSVSREGTFATDLSDPARLRAVLRGFSESIAAQLRSQGRRARTITLKLRYGDFRTVSRSITLARPVSSDDAVFAAASRLLEQVRASDGSAVRLIGVGASNLVSDARQLALEPTAEVRQEALSVAFDHVRKKFGRRSLQTGRTAFDSLTGDDGWRHTKATGLSSQMDG